ncbi:two-component sensor PhoR [Nitrococcus mobilis Nb-231]|uniref:histidine kinase n=2 Tax=Nitrococcus mobilis TaxID=35797 RepID=A4BSW1_9GAMM|nr:two-component sensor PhoR [Nitrococcus mobilis Nb-231]
MRLALLLLIAALIGLASGYVTLALLLALVLFLGVQIRSLVRFERWLRQGRQLRPPRSEGLWATLFEHFYRLQRRHRERRQRLAELLRRFKESANAMPDATVVLRGMGEMQWWNAMAERYLGLEWPRDQGQRIANLFRHPFFSEFLAHGDWYGSVKVPSPLDEHLILEIRIVPYGQERKLLVARDVTRLHRLEVMRRDFVANITHELRTPLTVIQGVAETLSEQEEAGSEDFQRSLELIQEQSQRMSRLVDDLLLLSRLETGERKSAAVPVDVAAMLEALAVEASALSGGRHRIELDIDRDLKLHGDQTELRSAFSNLVVNAVKYTPADGRIVIRWFVDDDAVHMQVVDTGFGIPPHHLPRLTERFYRVDSGHNDATAGTGLGLTIVKHVLSRHDARLEIRSQLNKGSTFDCLFPVKLSARGLAASASPGTSSP